MSRRKKKKEEVHVDESWLLPYADILTLLLALFIVLYASSTIDSKKFQSISKVFNEIFTSGNGVMEYTSPVESDKAGEIKVTSTLKNKAKETTTTQSKDNLDKLKAQDQKALQDLQAKINAYIKTNHYENKFATKMTDEGLLITILDNVLFDSGNASIRKSDESKAKELSNLLVMNPPRNIIISGYTDNVPVHNSHFDSNWELSAMRALNFMKIITENKQLNTKYFSIKGYGETKPVTSNNTAKGRAKNRRVEVLIQPIVQEAKIKASN